MNLMFLRFTATCQKLPESETQSIRRQREAEWEDETPSHRSHTRRGDSTGAGTSRYATPVDLHALRDGSPRHSSWEDSGLGSSRASTPYGTGHLNSEPSKERYVYTPMPTPTFKHNAWMKMENSKRSDSRRVRESACDASSHGDRSRRPDTTSEIDNGSAGVKEIDPEELKAENERLDRNWYQMDDGYDGDNNPFSGNSLVTFDVFLMINLILVFLFLSLFSAIFAKSTIRVLNQSL